MTYTREQDIAAIIRCLKTGKPKRKALILRLFKKYGHPQAICVAIDALEKMKKEGKKK